jgi:hypothetical protein
VRQMFVCVCECLCICECVRACVRVCVCLPVEAPIAPMRTEGTAMTRQPAAAMKDRTWAYVAEEAERTR